MDELRLFAVPGHEGLSWCADCGTLVPHAVPAALAAHASYHASREEVAA